MRRYKSDKCKFLRVNAREYSDNLVKGLELELALLKSKRFLTKNQFSEDMWITLVDDQAFALFVRGSIESAKLYIQASKMDDSTKDALSSILSEIDDNQESGLKTEPSSIVANFQKYASMQEKFPILIIDEANLVLGNELNGTKELLAQFVKNTKQNRTMNVILSTSEHAYPYKLKAENLKLVDLANVVLAGELSPKKTLEFLVTASYPNVTVVSGKKIIGMGPKLVAELFLAAYGGHLLSMEKAVQRLALKQEQFKAKDVLPTMYVSEINTCLSMKGSFELLDRMARVGFAPIEDYNSKTTILPKTKTPYHTTLLRT